MAERTQDKGRTNVTLRLDVADARAVKLEAARRVQTGEASRFDQSGVVRDALRFFFNSSHREDTDAEDGGGRRER